MNRLLTPHVEVIWRMLVMLGSALDPLGHEGEYLGAALVSELLSTQRVRYASVIKLADDDCILNPFTLECKAPHAPAIRSFPRVEGPAGEGKILDFLGISTDQDVVCPKRLLAGAAVSRWFDCQGHAEGTWRHALPMWDEEYIEWVDVLGAAWLAGHPARRGARDLG